jgi:stearoyl-CoA desaturase (delta-9 desaturase)
MRSTLTSQASSGIEDVSTPAGPLLTRQTRLQRLGRGLTTLGTLVLHGGAAYAILFVQPSLSDGLIAAVFYVLGMFVITGGYHRYFSHRAYKTSRAFQGLLAFVGCLCTQKGALWWAATHRKHHRFSDATQDPHSPHQRGFWHSHIFWTLTSEYEGYESASVRDLYRFPELRLLDRFCTLPLFGYIALTALLGGWSGVGWWYCVPTVALMHAVMMINSLSHLWGHRRFATSDHSRNNPLLALLTLGEGWHNNHHRYMASANQGFYWWQVDITYYVLLALQALGIIWDLRVPPAHVLKEGRTGVATGALTERAC